MNTQNIHPGDRVQMDVCKIAPGLYHYVAVDDCTRYRVLGLFPRRNGSYTMAFLERVVEEMPFPIQRVQTDRGREFFALSVQPWLKHASIKVRPIRPASPHLNGIVCASSRSRRRFTKRSTLCTTPIRSRYVTLNTRSTSPSKH